MGEFSITHWFFILAILLLLFGPSKLPGLGSSLGKAIRGFKSGLNDPDPDEKAASTTAKPEQIRDAASTKTAETEKVKDPNKV